MLAYHVYIIKPVLNFALFLNMPDAIITIMNVWIIMIIS